MRLRPTALMAAVALALGLNLAAADGGPRPDDALRHQLAKERRAFAQEKGTLLRKLRVAASPPPAADPVSALLGRIARCESGGRPSALSPGGTYRGMFQFDLSTWRSVGGYGDPASAHPIEQWYRAFVLYQRRGVQPWPVCGRL